MLIYGDDIDAVRTSYSGPRAQKKALRVLLWSVFWSWVECGGAALAGWRIFLGLEAHEGDHGLIRGVCAGENCPPKLKAAFLRCMMQFKNGG
jgi:hypothetical protein